MEAQKILVFGDGRHLFRTICWILEYKGYHVSLAPNPEIALDLLIGQDYDLIIARLIMEDLQRLEVLKRAKRLNPAVKIMAASSNGNAAFPLESYRIEIDDYLLLPSTASELLRRVSQCLQKQADKAPGLKRGAKINADLSSRIMIMLHDIRGSLVSTGASLKLIKRGKYGAINSQAAEQIQELFDRIKNSSDLIEEFVGEVLTHHVRAASAKRVTSWRRGLPKPVVKELISDL
jgi:DNA-binding response OmpR family regulator